MQNKEFTFNKDFVVTSADVDFEGYLNISSLTNFFIQSAWSHAENLGWGVDEMHKHNLSWVLSSMQIKLNSYPKWRESIRIETWPKGINRLFYLRDFIIYNSKNEIIGTSTSNWMLIDIERRRPKLHNLDDAAIRFNKDKHAIKEVIPPIEINGEAIFSMEYQTKFSDIDINTHLTATRYVDLMYDTFSLEEFKAKRPNEVTISFMKEVKFNELVQMNKYTCDNKTLSFQLISKNSEKCCFKAEMVF